jgi:ADP-ribose pyrophosphatase YjhB (NUDIX family)
MDRRITTRGIIYKNGKIFAQKLKRGEGTTDYWCTPGGGLDPSESLHAGLVREMIEETGIAPEIGKLLYVQQYREENGREYLEFFYHVTNVDDYETIDLASTTHGEIEVAEYGFIDPAKENILPKFLQTADIAKDIEAGQVQEFSYL